jgi:hypothetical protein
VNGKEGFLFTVVGQVSPGFEGALRTWPKPREGSGNWFSGERGKEEGFRAALKASGDSFELEGVTGLLLRREIVERRPDYDGGVV